MMCYEVQARLNHEKVKLLQKLAKGKAVNKFLK